RAAEMARAEAEAINALGTTYAVNGAYSKAISEYGRAVAVADDSLEAHRNLGLAMLRQAASKPVFEGALPHLARVEQLVRPDDPPALKSRSQFDLGEFFLNRARFLDRHPGDPGDYAQATADYAQAAERFRKAL